MAGSFVHLHNHTEYSMLDGAAKVSPLFAEAKRLGMTAIGMTDHGNMFGASEFYNTAIKNEIKPIIGIEAYIAPESRFDTKRIQWGTRDQKGDDVSGSGAYTHMTMVAENATGLRNLFKLSSLASIEGQLGKWARMDADLIAEHAEGIIATTGCPSGEVQTRLRLGQYDAARAAGVPLNKALTIRADGRDPFKTADNVRATALAFFSTRRGARPLRAWLAEYLAWRYQVRDRYLSLPWQTRAAGSGGDDVPAVPRIVGGGMVPSSVVHTSSTSFFDRERETQSMIVSPRSFSALDRIESRCSGVPSSTSASQVPQMPSMQDPRTSTPAFSTASKIVVPSGTVTLTPEREHTTSNESSASSAASQASRPFMRATSLPGRSARWRSAPSPSVSTPRISRAP